MRDRHQERLDDPQTRDQVHAIDNVAHPTLADFEHACASPDERIRDVARAMEPWLKEEWALEKVKKEASERWGEGETLNEWDDQKLSSAYRATIASEHLARTSAPEIAHKIEPIPGPSHRDPLKPRLVLMTDRESDKLDRRDDYTQAGADLIRKVFSWAREETFELRSVRKAGSGMVGMVEKDGKVVHGLQESERGPLRDADVFLVWAEDGFVNDLPSWGEPIANSRLTRPISDLLPLAAIAPQSTS